MRRKKCLCCYELYHPRPQTYHQQKTCNKPECRAWRKRHNWRMWSLKNPYNWESRRSKQSKWRQAHHDYWRKWRENHAQYVIRNRDLQKLRNAKMRKKVAKPTTWNAICRYKIERIRYVRLIAKPTGSIEVLSRQIDGICRYLRWQVLIAKPNSIDKESIALKECVP